MKISIFISVVLLLIFTEGCGRETTINQPDDGLPPAVPTNLSVYSASDGEVVLDWDKNSEIDLKGYNIYRKVNGDSSFTFLAFTNDNYYYDDSLNYNLSYSYEVTAIDMGGLESKPSKIVSAVPANKYRPQVPKNLIVNARNYDGKIYIYLSWQSNYESDIAHYNIYRSPSPGFTPDNSNLIGSAVNNNFSDTAGIHIYQNFYYKIKAVDNGGLVSDAGSEEYDMPFPTPEVITPAERGYTGYFSYFELKELKYAAKYQIVVQSNPYFGELWNKTIYTEQTNDTLAIKFDPKYIFSDTPYYWRVITYSNSNSEPNSISRLYKFIIKP